MPRRLTILSDLRAAQWNGDRGIAAYSQSLVLQICRDHPEHRHVFLWDDRLPPPLRTGELAEHGEWWTEGALADRFDGRIDSLLTTCFFLPDFGRGGEYILPRWLALHQPHRLGIVYDLIPLLFPDRYFSTPQSRGSYLESLRLLRRYDQLFAISQATRRDTILHAGFDGARVHCVYGDIDHRKRGIIDAGGDAGAAARHGLRQPFAFCIGGEDWRKNMDGMVRAFALFHRRHPDHQLAIVCTLSAERKAAIESLAASLDIRAGAVVCTGHVSDEELIGILGRADMMVFPSLYEGLGLPVLEAHGCGVPVAGSNNSSIAELVVPELTFDPEHPGSIAAAMERLSGEPALRTRSVNHGRELLHMLGWQQAAALVMATLEDRSGGRPASRGASLAVVATEPPDAGNARRWAGLEGPGRIDSFTPWIGVLGAAASTQTSRSRHLPIEILRTAIDTGSHGALLFVLRNSPADVPVLEAIMKTRLGCRARRIAYLQDADLDILVDAFLRISATDRRRSADGNDGILSRGGVVPASSAGWSLRFLMEMAALDGVVVGDHRRRDGLRAALGDDAKRWSIDVVPPQVAGSMPCDDQPGPKAIARPTPA